MKAMIVARPQEDFGDYYIVTQRTIQQERQVTNL